VAKAGVTAKDVEAAYRKRYGKEPFVRLSAAGAASVHEGRAGSNFCDIAWRCGAEEPPGGGRLAIDNLVKGARRGGACNAST